jgi:myo-inositol 2-dehydrogenase / D-chiro-inositol 1-dehydrogenase
LRPSAEAFEPEHAHAIEDKQAMQHPIGFAVFGAGRMGTLHIANIASHAAAKLVYVVDPDEARAEGVASQFSAKATVDTQRALDDPDVQAVVIVSATNTHVDLIIAAARAGKAILCEKPIDLSLARVEECERGIAAYPVPIMIGFQRRFDPTHHAVHTAITNGEIGNIETISIVSRDPQPPPAAYIATSGGQFHDQMIHDFDMALWLSGATGHVEVFAMASNLVDPEIGRLGDTDTAQVLMRFESAAICRIECSRRAVYGYDQRIEVFGSKGMVCSGNMSATTIVKYTNEVTSARDRLLPDFMQRYLPSYARELDSFIQALQTGAVIASDFASGKRALVLADAARTSYLTNKPVSIELQ